MIFICDSRRHLICVPYSIGNLHQMAIQLGIHRCWYHGGRFPHYDIPKRRILEIRPKCKVVSERDLLRAIKEGLVE